MDCAMIVRLLSDYHDGLLPEPEKTLTGDHLISCPCCKGIYDDLVLIVIAASELRQPADIDFPVEKVWQRLGLGERWGANDARLS
jgi:predicted anti-sigma-YlaC factor YlaD